MATTPTSRQDDVINGMDKLLEAAKLARANSDRELPQDPRKSPAVFIPPYINFPPQIRVVYGHWVRIWRSTAIERTKHDFRRCIGLAEFTPLEDPDSLTTGLEWSYSANPPPEWEQYPYVFYGHYPGDRPCRDLVSVYHSCTLEIDWAIINLRPEGLKLYRQEHKNGGPNPEETEPKSVHDAETGERIA